MIFQLLQQATMANFHAPIAPGIKLAYCGTHVCKRNCSGAERAQTTIHIYLANDNHWWSIFPLQKSIMEFDF